MTNELKTNVMRLLEQAKIDYLPHHYDPAEGGASGVFAARKVKIEPERVFKTLVTRAASRSIHVFVIPVEEELDLKRAAKAVGEKSVEMVAVKELPGLTGYVRGGCSPIGMKKPYPVTVDETAVLFDRIAVSAGKIGAQVELSPGGLQKMTGCEFLPVTK